MSLIWIMLEQLTSGGFDHVVDGIVEVLNSGSTKGGIAQDVTNVVGAAGAAGGMAGAVASAAGAGAAGAGAVGGGPPYPASPDGIARQPSLMDRLNAEANPSDGTAEDVAARRRGDPSAKSPETIRREQYERSVKGGAERKWKETAGQQPVRSAKGQVPGGEPVFSEKEIKAAADFAKFGAEFTQKDTAGPPVLKLVLKNPVVSYAARKLIGYPASWAAQGAVRAVNAADAAMLAPYRIEAAQYAASQANGGYTPNTVGGGFSGDEAGFSGTSGYTGTSSGPNASYGPRP